MRIKITLLLLIVLTITMSCGVHNEWEQGYLVLKTGDTLVGQMKLPIVNKSLFAYNGKEKVKFRNDQKSKRIKYDESQVAKIFFSYSDYFEYVNLSKNKKSIFKVIAKGKVTLYSRSVYYQVSSQSGGSLSDEYYVLRENETIASPLIKTNTYSPYFRKRAIEYFSDCPTLVSKLENKSYDMNDIREVINYYNTAQ